RTWVVRILTGCSCEYPGDGEGLLLLLDDGGVLSFERFRHSVGCRFDAVGDVRARSVQDGVPSAVERCVVCLRIFSRDQLVLDGLDRAEGHVEIARRER